MKRVLTCLIAVIVVSALQSSSAFAQGAWPLPAKTPNTPVTRGSYTTIGYPLPITTFVGRYLDSEQTRDYQQTFRTVRANKIRIVPERNRIYMLIGSSLFAYNLDTFFTRLAAGEQMMGATQIPVSPANTCNTCRKPELPLDYFLKPDSFFYAENGGGWITPFVDGQDRLYDFDTDDRNNVYMAAEIFGWGVAVDGGGTGLNRLFGPQYAPGLNDVIPMKIMSVKTTGGQYYVLVSSDFGGSAVWNATDVNAAVKQPVGGHEIVAYAKAQNGTRIALVSPAGNVEFYTNDTIATGGGPFQSFHNADGYFGVDSDGTNFYATSYSAAAGLVISVFAPNGNSYAETKYPVGGTYVNFMPKVRWGANYLTVYGPQQFTCTAPCNNGAGWNVRLFSLPNGVPTEISINNYIAAYYSTLLYSKPDGGYYSHPPSYMFMHDSLIYRSGSKYYFLVAARGLGDVYEIKGADTLTASVKTIGDTRNPNSKAPAGAGPFYGDNVTFTAVTSSQISFLINWAFGDGTTGSSVTGLPEVAHQFGGQTAATLPATLTVTATSALDAGINDHINVTLQAPAVRLGIKGTPLLFTQPAAGSSAPIVAGDAFTDASDGAVEGHFGDWTFDGVAPIRGNPTAEFSVGDCGAHTLSFAAHYGPYNPDYTPRSTEALYTISPLGYTVRPMVSLVGPPTSDATNVYFNSATRIGSGASVPGGGGTAATYTWQLVNASAEVLLTATGTASLASIPQFTVPKTYFQNATGLSVRLTLGVPTEAIGPACAPYAQSLGSSDVLEAPNVSAIVASGCANVGSPCTLSVTGNAKPDWTYNWSIASLAGANTATYSPVIPVEGSYTVNVTVSNALGSTTLSKPLSVGPRLCSSAPTENNTAISYSGPVSHCYNGVACNAGEQISFIMSPYNWTPSDCDKYTWSFGDGSGQSTAISPKHAYASNGNYQVTLTLVGGVSTAVVHATVVVGAVVQPPPPPPPPPPPTGCGALGPGSLYIGFYGQQSACSLTNPNCNADENIYFNIYGSGYDVNCGLSFNWNFGDTGASSTSTLQAPTKKYTVGGNYTVNVLVRTPNNSQQTYTAAIKINGGGPPPPGGGCGLTNASYYIGYYGPTSFCTANAPGCVRDENIAFSALPFASPCNSATFSWNFGDNGTATGAQPRHKFVTDGLYKVVLTIADGSTIVTASEDVKVGNPTPTGPPTRIDFSAAALEGKENWYEFSAFSIPAGKITQWHWDFGDGSGSDLATIKHGYPDAGKYTVTLTSPQLPGVVVKRDTIGQPHRRAAGR